MKLKENLDVQIYWGWSDMELEVELRVEANTYYGDLEWWIEEVRINNNYGGRPSIAGKVINNISKKHIYEIEQLIHAEYDDSELYGELCSSYADEIGDRKYQARKDKGWM